MPRGRIKVRPEDFVVEEIPAYAPTGTGEHVFIRFTKTDPDHPRRGALPHAGVGVRSA